MAVVRPSQIAVAEGADISLATTIVVIGGVLTAIPKASWGPDVVYVGVDSPFLVGVAITLALDTVLDDGRHPYGALHRRRGPPPPLGHLQSLSENERVAG